jgi:hypothetical protein
MRFKEILPGIRMGPRNPPSESGLNRELEARSNLPFGLHGGARLTSKDYSSQYYPRSYIRLDENASAVCFVGAGKRQNLKSFPS